MHPRQREHHRESPRVEVAVDREIPLTIDLSPAPATVRVRVVRCEAADVALPGAVWRRQQQYALGVIFLKPSGEALKAIQHLTRTVSGIEKSSPRVLVLGDEDDVSALIGETLTEADYITRLLSHPRYTISIAKRIGAKAIVVNLRIDPRVLGAIDPGRVAGRSCHRGAPGDCVRAPGMAAGERRELFQPAAPAAA